MAYRIIVCIDVETDTLKDAYKQVYDGMTKAGLDWESSDEWYDQDGDAGDPDVLQEARMAVFEDRCEHGLFFSGAGACPQCGGGAE